MLTYCMTSKLKMYSPRMKPLLIVDLIKDI